MKILLMGQGLCAERCLKALTSESWEIIGLVIPGNRPASKLRPVKQFADANRISVFQPQNVNHPAFIQLLRNLDPDLIISSSFTQIFSKELINVPTNGCINVHCALLPIYRGLHAHNWAIINGETETGVTFHFIDEDVDTGDILAMSKVEITLEDDAFTLRDKVTKLAAILLPKVISQIDEGTVRRVMQNERLAHYWPPRKPEDGLIDWSRSAWEIYNLVRALVPPWPGAFTIFRDEKLRIMKAELVSGDFEQTRNIAPGQFSRISNRKCFVATGNGHLQLTGLMMGQDAPCTGSEFASKYGVRVGQQLGN